MGLEEQGESEVDEGGRGWRWLRGLQGEGVPSHVAGKKMGYDGAIVSREASTSLAALPPRDMESSSQRTSVMPAEALDSIAIESLGVRHPSKLRTSASFS